MRVILGYFGIFSFELRLAEMRNYYGIKRARCPGVSLKNFLKVDWREFVGLVAGLDQVGDEDFMGPGFF